MEKTCLLILLQPESEQSPIRALHLRSGASTLRTLRHDYASLSFPQSPDFSSGLFIEIGIIKKFLLSKNEAAQVNREK